MGLNRSQRIVVFEHFIFFDAKLAFVLSFDRQPSLFHLLDNVLDVDICALVVNLIRLFIITWKLHNISLSFSVRVHRPGTRQNWPFILSSLAVTMLDFCVASPCLIRLRLLLLADLLRLDLGHDTLKVLLVTTVIVTDVPHHAVLALLHLQRVHDHLTPIDIATL